MSAVKRHIRDAMTSRPVGRAVRRATGARVPSHGLRIRTDYPGIDVRTDADLFFRFYEKNELRFIRKALAPDRDVIELGGSIGVTGAHILRRLEPPRRLVTVEANPALISALRANLDAQGAGRYEVVQGAIDYSGAPSVEVQLSASVVDSHVGRYRESESVKVPTLTLADLLPRLTTQRYSLMCDIEGAEHPLVQHDREALGRCDQIIMELHGYPKRYEPTRRALTEELGFREVARGRYVFVYERCQAAAGR